MKFWEFYIYFLFRDVRSVFEFSCLGPLCHVDLFYLLPPFFFLFTHFPFASCFGWLVSSLFVFHIILSIPDHKYPYYGKVGYYGDGLGSLKIEDFDICFNQLIKKSSLLHKSFMLVSPSFFGGSCVWNIICSFSVLKCID